MMFDGFKLSLGLKKPYYITVEKMEIQWSKTLSNNFKY